MIDFFIEGGWSMWLILLVGGALVGASLRFAMKPHGAKKEFLKYLSFATIAASLHGMLMDVGMVFWYCTDSTRCPDAELTRTLLQGFKESTRPGTFGGGLLVIALVLMAIGSSRLARKEDPAA